MTMKMVFDESYGDMSFAQRAAYRKHNVSPSDHWELVEQFGTDYAAITKYVKHNAANNAGVFSVFDLWGRGVS